MNDNGLTPLTPRHKLGLVIFAVVIVVFGCITEMRGAFLHSRRTDAGVYFRAGWAIRSGADLYRIQDDNGWHYLYPPLFAILMTPFADPPAGSDRDGTIPYAVSLGIWYVASCLFLFAAAHLLAAALEDASPSLRVRSIPRYCERWWALRMLPVLICLLPIGRNLARGQVGTLLLLLLCGMVAATLRGHRWRAGLWLAAAICLKIIPVLLLLVPLQRRDWRMLSGCFLGLVLGMLVIPGVVLGPEKTVDAYRSVINEVLQPGFQAATDGSRGKELTGVSSTDSNSPQVITHNLLFPNRDTRPKEVAGAARIVHWGCAALLIALTWMAGSVRRSPFTLGSPGNGPDSSRSPSDAVQPGEASNPTEPREYALNRQTALALASLSLVMLVVSPVYHPHYFSLAVLPVMLLLSSSWEQHGYARWDRGMSALFIGIILSHLLTVIPGLWPLRDFGLVLVTTLWLWWVCVRDLYRQSTEGTL